MRGAGIGLAAVLATSGASRAMSAGPERAAPVLAYACPPASGAFSADLAAALCAALRKGLAAAAPGYRLRPQDAAPAPGSGDIGLVLVLDGQGPDRLRGHLEWRRGPRGRPETGATVTLDALDTGLRPDMFENFVTVLLRASALPFATDQTDG